MKRVLKSIELDRLAPGTGPAFHIPWTVGPLKQRIFTLEKNRFCDVDNACATTFQREEVVNADRTTAYPALLATIR